MADELPMVRAASSTSFSTCPKTGVTSPLKTRSGLISPTTTISYGFTGKATTQQQSRTHNQYTTRFGSGGTAQISDKGGPGHCTAQPNVPGAGELPAPGKNAGHSLVAPGLPAITGAANCHTRRTLLASYYYLPQVGIIINRGGEQDPGAWLDSVNSAQAGSPLLLVGSALISTGNSAFNISTPEIVKRRAVSITTWRRSVGESFLTDGSRSMRALKEESHIFLFTSLGHFFDQMFDLYCSRRIRVVVDQ